MSSRNERENAPYENKLEDCLRDVILNQIVTRELWEIDECVHFLFDLNSDNKCGL